MNTKKYLLLGFGLAAILIGWFVIFQGEPDYTQPTGGENIIFFGDSLVAGVGATNGQDLTTQLSNLTGLPILNAGVSGDTSVSALNRLETDVLQKNPKIVIVMLGGNDFLQRLPAESTNASIRTIVEKILQTGAGVILINENKVVASRSTFEDLAKEKNIPYIENALGRISRDKSLMSDTIHPNSKGYGQMAEQIKPVLEAYLGM